MASLLETVYSINEIPIRIPMVLWNSTRKKHQDQVEISEQLPDSQNNPAQEETAAGTVNLTSSSLQKQPTKLADVGIEGMEQRTCPTALTF